MAKVSRNAILIIIAVSLLSIVMVRCFGYKISPFTTIDGIEGHSPESIVARLGEPDSGVQFYLSDHDLDYRLGLHTLFPSQSDSTIMIKEMIWYDFNTFLASYTLVIWFHKENGQWKVIDNLGWSKDIEF